MTATVYESRMQRSRRRSRARLFFIVGVSLFIVAGIILVISIANFFTAGVGTGMAIEEWASAPNWLSWNVLSLITVVCAALAWRFRHPQARILFTCAALLLVADSLSFFVQNSPLIQQTVLTVASQSAVALPTTAAVSAVNVSQ